MNDQEDLERRLRSSVQRWQEQVGSPDVSTLRRNQAPGTRRRSMFVAVAAVLVAIGVPSAYVATTDRDNRPSGTDHVTVELACPAKLAQASWESHGFGTNQVATSRPNLPEPQGDGVVCVYTTLLNEPSPGDPGVRTTWTRQTSQHSVPATEIASGLNHLGGPDRLGPPSHNVVCASNLGPRFLLMYRAGSRTIGVLIDDFGCQAVRLTSDPAERVAGEDEMLPAGVFYGGQQLLDTLKEIVWPTAGQGP